MTIDKKYFLDRLANGEDIDDIGKEIADMMNSAIAEFEAEQAKIDKENAKRELVEEMGEILHELAILEGMDDGDFTLSPEEVSEIIAGLDEMFAAMRELKRMFAAEPTPKAPLSDDDLLGDFIKTLLS